MKVKEVIGILVVECHNCGQQFVVNTEAIKEGFQWGCQCGRGAWCGPGANIDIKFNSGLSYDDMGDIGRKRMDKHWTTASAMPLEEYKRMLAGVILEGRKPKVPPKHKNAVGFHLNNEDHEKLYATLRQLGFKKEEAIAKVDIAVQEGFIHEPEIIKYILSLP